ncbi:MAG: ATP-dependent DNA helicase [Actinomycetaceae bacterium]|nr:ATP-dependent DNA helicase [Actinomycetaceae bacterium]
MSEIQLSAHDLVAALNEYVPPTRQLQISDEQAQVIESPLTPHLVVAGAGSGKTETMSLRVLWLVANYGFAPDRILGLTFTRKAAGELASRLRMRLSQLVTAGLIEAEEDNPWFAGGINVSTYNSFASSIVREYGLLEGVEPGSRLITDAAAWQLMEHILNTYTAPLPSRAISTIRDDALALSAALLDHDISIEEAKERLQHTINALSQAEPEQGTRVKTLDKTSKSWLQGAEEQLLLLDLIDEYRAYKRAMGMVDFSDQLGFARQLVRQHDEVCGDVRSSYDAVLLDEFQDTSVGQMELLSSLFADGAVTAVGDPNQAIYGWRGASAASLATFLEHFDSHDRGNTLHLTYAWRNQPNILDAANQISSPLTAATSDALEIRQLNSSPAHVKGSGTIRYLYAADEKDEYELVARAVKQWQLDDEQRVAQLRMQPHTRTDAPIKRQTYGILARNRRHFVPMLEACIRHDIEAVVIGLGGLVTQPAIADIRAALTACVHPEHGPSAMRLLANLDLSSSDLRTLYAWAKELQKKRSTDPNERGGFLIDAIDNPPPVGWSTQSSGGLSAGALRRIKLLARRLDRLRSILDQPITHVVSACVRIFDIDIETKADPVGNAAMETVDAFIDVASSFEHETAFATLSGFLDWIDRTVDAEQGLTAPSFEVDDHVVRIMTIHQAKGLEWDKVAVIGLREGDFPQARSAQHLKSSIEPPEVSADMEVSLRPAKAWIGARGQVPHDWRLDYQSRDGSQILPRVPDIEGLGLVGIREAVADYTEELARHGENEERRLAYVAYTRPKNELLLAGAWRREGTASALLPSRYLLDLIRSGHAKPASAQMFAGDAETLPEPVISVCPPPEEQSSTPVAEGSFPRVPGYVRNLINESAQRVIDMQDDLPPIDDAADVRRVVDYHSADPQESELLIHVSRALEAHRHRIRSQTPVVSIDHISATASANLLKDPQEFALSLRRPVPQEPSDAAVLGSAFHRWAETWCVLAAPFDETKEPQTQTPVDAMSETPADEVEDTLTASQIKRLEEMKTVAIELFGQRPAGIIAVEKPFSFAISGLTMRGRMDAVASIDGRLRVIDWKTGRPPTPEHPGHVWDYAVQLDIYRRALAAERGIDPDDVDAELVFLGGHGYTSEQRRVNISSLEAFLGPLNFDEAWEKIATGAFSHARRD